jgi:hypothetical protein
VCKIELKYVNNLITINLARIFKVWTFLGTGKSLCQEGEWWKTAMPNVDI